MDLSVIIVSYNVRRYLEKCLYSVLKASSNLDAEIFVVDNNSADGSGAMVSEKFPTVRLIANPVNRGFSAANNQALRLASGKYILLLNPDTVVEESTFRKCISFMNDHPDCGAQGVRMTDGEGRFLPESRRSIPTPASAFFKIFGLAYIFPNSKLFNRYYLGQMDPSIACRADVISGAFMFLRHDAVLEAGFLDESFFMYGEDIDYSCRLKQAGFSNYYNPNASIIHYKGESARINNFRSMAHFYKAMVIYVRKHFSKGRLSIFVIVVISAIYIKAGAAFLYSFLKTLLHRRRNPIPAISESR